MRTDRRAYRFLSTAVPVIVLAACGAARAGGGAFPTELLRSGRVPVDGQECQLLEVPGGMPGEQLLFDAAAARTALAAVPAEARATSPYAVIDLNFVTEGERNRLRILDSTLPPIVTEALLASAVIRGPAGFGRPGSQWGLVVVAMAGPDGDTFTSHPAEYCSAYLINAAEVSRLLTSAPAAANTPMPPGSRREVLLDVSMDTAGVVTQTRLAQSTGSVALDTEIMKVVGQMRWAPALLNRRPFEVVNRIPLGITAAAPAAQR